MEKNDQNIEFLQSEQWLNFQKSAGRETHFIKNDVFSVGMVEHVLPMVGKYFYCPRGPVFSANAERISNFQFPISNEFSNPNDKIKKEIQKLVDLAKEENAGWIRIEPQNKGSLELIRENITLAGQAEKIVKAPHDMQPREVFVLDITKTEEELLQEMKSKTRYNINLARKKGVIIVKSEKSEVESLKYAEEFLKLTKEMSERHGITSHPEGYYQKMIQSLPSEMLKIYVAKFEDNIIAANLVLFYGNTATYLHGASGNTHRNLMAPFVLQWQAILDAKKMGYVKYDFGGVRTQITMEGVQDINKWEGITTFKLGFSPKTKPVVFPGSWDIVINPRKYAVYRGLQKAKALLYKISK
jgi:lipid II:glycine glycyltransferase (peptidoglycan interpeptide bridge formation enzyme)